MAKTVINDGITSVIEEKKETFVAPRVRIKIPMPADMDSGVKIDPYEHVTINGEKPTYIKKGEWVDVPVPVYMQLKNRYPDL